MISFQYMLANFFERSSQHQTGLFICFLDIFVSVIFIWALARLVIVVRVQGLVLVEFIMIHRCSFISRLIIFIFVSLIVIRVLCIFFFVDNADWHFIWLSILLVSALIFNSIFALLLLGLIVKLTVCEDISVCAFTIIIVLSIAIRINIHQLIFSFYWVSYLIVDDILTWLYIWLFYYLLIHHWTCILPCLSDCPNWSFYHFI